MIKPCMTPLKTAVLKVLARSGDPLRISEVVLVLGLEGFQMPHRNTSKLVYGER